MESEAYKTSILINKNKNNTSTVYKEIKTNTTEKNLKLSLKNN